MRIISHRGAWKFPHEKNTLLALGRSFELGFGVETDLRDHKGQIVISHDMPMSAEPSFQDLISLIGDNHLPLALNVKADGLAEGVRSALNGAGLMEDAFVFDMAIPDMRAYLDNGIPVFTRMSEVERFPAWPDEAAGIWLDSLNGIWYDPEFVARLLESGKRVCVVSPELHGRPHSELWKQLSTLATDESLLLCTDFPLEASRFFGDLTSTSRP